MLGGETGVTPHNVDIEEAPQEDKSPEKLAVNADDDSSSEGEQEVDPEDFVTLAMNKNNNSRGRSASVATVHGDPDPGEDSDDSFKTDSSGDSILSGSEDEDLDEADKALQNQILTNFVAVYKRGFSKMQSSILQR